MEGVLCLATLAQKWRLRLVPEHKITLQPQLTLRARHGISDGLVRLSVGLENVDDLLADISQALDAAASA